MKKIFLALSCLAITQIVNAQPPKGDANKGMTFGEKIEATEAIGTDELATKLEEAKKLEVKVQGVVSQVCSKEGCWLKLKTANGNMMVKMKDHKFLVPLSMEGKTIVAKGFAEKKVTSVEMLKHYAEDAGKSKAEIEAIKEPKTEIIFQATGIIVVE